MHWFMLTYQIATACCHLYQPSAIFCVQFCSLAAVWHCIFATKRLRWLGQGPKTGLFWAQKTLNWPLLLLLLLLFCFFIFKVNKIIITIINIYEMTCCWQIVLFNCCVLIDRTFPQSHSPLPPPSAASADPSHTLPDCLELPDLPSLPSIPTNSVGRTSLTNDDVDFDDLTRRFEELKKRNWFCMNVMICQWLLNQVFM